MRSAFFDALLTWAKIRSILRSPSRALLLAFLLGALLQLAATLLAPPRGLQAEYFASEHPGGTPAISAIDDRITTRNLQLRWYGAPPATFSAQWFGYLAIPRSGTYTLELTSDDAGKLSVDGRQVIDNGGRHEARAQRASVPLDAGLHPVLVELTQYGGDYAIELRWAREGGRLSSVPSWALSPFKVSFSRVLAARALELCALGAFAIAAALAASIAWRNRFLVFRYPRWSTLALFVVLAVVNTWPMATDPGHLTRNDNRDTILNEWILAWVVHQAPRDPLHLFDANIFYPERHTLAFSEPMLPQAAMGAPLLALGASPVLTYNLLLLAGFALTGWSMCLVIQQWTSDWTAGLVSGVTFAFNAHVLTRIPHLQAQHVEFLPAALFALDALLRQPSAGRAMKLAFWSILQATTSIYLLVFTFFAIVAGVLARPGDWMGRRFVPLLKALALAGALACVAIVPLLVPYYHANQEQGLTRSLADAAVYAASWRDYLSTPARLHYSLWSYRVFDGTTALFPGAIGVLLTLLAIVRGGALRDPRARLCLAAGLVGVLLSLGPTMPGYATLYALLPVLRAIRGTARFGYLATLAVAACAGFGMVTLRRLIPPRAWPAVATLVILATTIELFAAPLGLSRFDGIPPIYATLPNDPGVHVVEFPFFDGRSAQFHSSYMLNSTKHWHPIVNGYSGFQPPSFYDHAGVLEGFPDEASMALLRSLGVTHVFVHEDQMPAATLDLLKTRSDLVRTGTFGSIALYRRESSIGSGVQ